MNEKLYFEQGEIIDIEVNDDDFDAFDDIDDNNIDDFDDFDSFDDDTTEELDFTSLSF